MYWELAWAVTVHKAQASQWQAVLVTWAPQDREDEADESATPLPPLAEPGLWYTAMTRAQAALHVVSPYPLDAWLEPVRQKRDRSADRKSRLQSLMKNRVTKAGRVVHVGQAVKNDAGPRGRLYRPPAINETLTAPQEELR